MCVNHEIVCPSDINRELSVELYYIKDLVSKGDIQEYSNVRSSSSLVFLATSTKMV